MDRPEIIITPEVCETFRQWREATFEGDPMRQHYALKHLDFIWGMQSLAYYQERLDSIRGPRAAVDA